MAMCTRIRLFFETAYSLSGYRGDRALNGPGDRCPDSLVSYGGKNNWCKKKKYADSKMSGRSLKWKGALKGLGTRLVRIGHF